MKEQLIFKAFMEGVCHKFGIADAIAPLSKGFDTFCEAEEWHGAPMDWRSEYDDGKINTHENSADGFFATPREPIGYAILNNDTNALRDLHMGCHEAKEPWNASGYSEDFDKEGEFHYDFTDGYHQEFEEDWHRVVGPTDNQEALVKMLEYVPNFWLCRADFINAFHAGYNKGLLAKLLRNYPNPDDTENNYLEWDGVTIPEVLSFLEQDDGSVHLLRESVEDYGDEFAETETPADSFYESASGASKSKWLRRIYNVAEPFTSHVYRDDNWSNVMDLFKTLREQVPEVKFTFGVTDGGYCCPGEDGMPRRKTYDVKATTPEGFDLVGSLHCDAAGSVEDPFDQYDMTLVLN